MQRPELEQVHKRLRKLVLYPEQPMLPMQAPGPATLNKRLRKLVLHPEQPMLPMQVPGLNPLQQLKEQQVKELFHRKERNTSISRMRNVERTSSMAMLQ
jgi:hypothetical protein